MIVLISTAASIRRGHYLRTFQIDVFFVTSLGHGSCLCQSRTHCRGIYDLCTYIPTLILLGKISIVKHSVMNLLGKRSSYSQTTISIKRRSSWSSRIVNSEHKSLEEQILNIDPAAFVQFVRGFAFGSIRAIHQFRNAFLCTTWIIWNKLVRK